MISNLGRYEIIEELGQGAAGIVYKAIDPLTNRNVAVKTINLQSLQPDEKLKYEAGFYQQARAFRRLSHPNIVTIHDLGESDNTAYLTMELLEGNQLHQLLKNPRCIGVEETLNIVIQIATGLAHAHKHGIVHRDIRPSNIMVLNDNRVKIADFGIAGAATSLIKMQTDKAIRSPWYMAPEQVLNRPIDCRSDIFSVGAVLFQMLTGRPPFLANNAHSVMYQIVHENPKKPSSLNHDVMDKLDSVVSKCLAKNPDERYQNAMELVNDLQICRGMQLQAQTIFDRRKTQAGAFLRKMPAGALLRRRWSPVEIMCIAVLISITLAISN